MIKAETKDRSLVVKILTQSFDDNKSVNYIIKQDSTRLRRLARLMEYSFDYCQLFGEVYLSPDRTACALTVLPDSKRTTLRSIALDVSLALSCIGLSNLKTVMSRETAIKKVHPSGNFYYLWFIGVLPSEQHRGVGTSLLKEILRRGESLHRPIYLETSMTKNLPWYKKFGFDVYRELDFGYKLFCLRRSLPPVRR
jgi:ribosomal protein S18 acetylase RimI-like enzyme